MKKVKQLFTIQVFILLLFHFEIYAQWNTSGSNVYTNGKVGIGKQPSIHKLDIDVGPGGSVNFEDDANRAIRFQLYNGSGTFNTISSEITSTGLLLRSKSGGNQLYLHENSNVGIGYVHPSSKLHIRDVGGSNEREELMKFEVSDAIGDYFIIKNSTTLDGQFIPGIEGYHVSDDRQALNITATIDQNTDTGDTPIMIFDSRSVGGDVLQRSLFGWNSLGVTKMTLNAQGKLGIGTAAPETLLDLRSTESNQNLLRLSHPSSPLNASFMIGYGQNKNLEDNKAIDFKVEYSDIEYNVLGIDRETRDFYYMGDGNVGIGTNDPKAKLSVDGNILATEIKVQTDVNDYPDFVFGEQYSLQPLTSLEEYIIQHKHLPEVPTAAEVEENGMDLGKMDKVLLQKIEELTLYLIEQDKRLKKLEQENKALKQNKE